MYGYGIDQDEVAAAEARDFKWTWEREKERVAGTVPRELRSGLQTLFKKIPHKGLFENEYVFVNAIAWRVYTEECLDQRQRKSDFNPDAYRGEPLLKFIDDEIVFAARRADEKKLGLTGSQVRTKVLEGLVKRAVELFGRWRSYDEPQPPCREVKEDGVINYIYEDRDNLRCDLREYIGF